MNTKERKPGLHTENRIPRKKADIIVEILKYISSYGHVGGLQITSLMYLCYVEHSRLKKFLVNLTDKKLVEYYKNSRRYKITQNGANFLEKYKTIRGSPKMLDSLQQNNGS
jgi:predicted transcriptional regulator